MKKIFFLPVLLFFIVKANAQQTVQQVLSLTSNGINSTEILMYKQNNSSFYSLYSNSWGFGFTNSTNASIPFHISSDDFIGLGTTTPTAKLDVNGNTIVRGSIISSLSDPNIGGSIQIQNPAKTAAGAANNWQIFNMTGSYGNSLQFWAYDNLGCTDPNGLCASRLTLMDNGNVGIGTSSPNEKLAVNGKIRAKEIKVENANWPDYVFAPSYKVPTLQETEKHIKEKGHLPGIPSASEVKANGVDLGDMNAKLLQKIEELTLHLIEKGKKDNEQQLKIDQLENRLNRLLEKCKQPSY
ncbi:hypothetical protein [Pedobacter frigoris]|uniref:SlyX family protein n=1 Tax=Pedobacter frigoris TaxID=2571272 RepID=A0A4U1CE21_9SPHI|nr:hypothetical protein [Pedobacter frigoris]TKC05244.1 hypothetical protein FA047_15930 [Pedobacter frigoris]